MIALVRIFILLLLLFPSLCIGSSYYVDYTDGDDTANGTSSSTPWKHCPGDSNATDNAAGASLSAGDIVYFKKGVDYVGQIDINTSWNGSEVDNGSNATITSSGVLTSTGQNFEATVQADDWIYIYNNSTTGDWIKSVGFWQIASVDSNTQLTLSGFDRDVHATAELTYRIWRPVTFTSDSSFGSGTATIDGNDSDYYQIAVQADYLLFKDLAFKDSKWPPEYPSDSCTNDTYAALYDNGETVTGYAVINCTFTNVWAISAVDAPSSGYFVFKDNSADGVGRIGYLGSGYGPDLIDSNTINDGGSCIRGAGAYSVVRDNVVTNCNHSSSSYCGNHGDGIGPLFSPAADPGGNQYGWIINNIVENTVEGIFLEYPNSGTSYWTIANNVLIGHYGDGGSGDAAIYVRLAPHTSIYNNTIFTVSTYQGWINGIKIEAYSGSGSSDCIIYNNLIYGLHASAPGMNIADSESQSNTVIDYNVTYTPNRAAPFEVSDVSKTFAQWQGLGYDANGDNSQPGLVDVSGSAYTDLNLGPTDNDTVIKDNGYTVSTFTFDLLWNNRPSGPAWDIGAYEYLYSNLLGITATGVTFQ